jgi:hypothetical protein
MLLKIGAVLASIPLAMGSVVAATGVMVVDVRDSDGSRIVVPVPLLFAQTAAGFAPTQGATKAIDRELARVPYLPAAEEAGTSAASPDFDLARGRG